MKSIYSESVKFFGPDPVLSDRTHSSENSTMIHIFTGNWPVRYLHESEIKKNE